MTLTEMINLYNALSAADGYIVGFILNHLLYYFWRSSFTFSKFSVQEFNLTNHCADIICLEMTCSIACLKVEDVGNINCQL